ncbi:MAG: mechanosensitive ion channel [Rhizobiaceae bacterium]|nr:mechanosensitive ion channel [Rhizobiaceae bacterium]MCV0408061.1 mechanosensitive ion channel [Rhizobiaceae bacterium]
MVDSAEMAARAASALAVQYSFSIVGAIILLIVGYVMAGLLERWTRSALARFRGFDETLQRFFAKVVRYAVLVVVGVTVLAQFGVQTASIIAALGAIGLAIGLALQGTLQNIAAGIMLLVLRPFRVGEYVDAGSVSGTIQEIGLFATEFKTYDGLYVLAPNSELWNSPVTNYSRNPVRMTEIKIGIGYDDDVDRAQAVYEELAAADDRILADPAPRTFVSELGDSAVLVSIRYWTSTLDWFSTKLDFTKAAKKAFDANGISIPFPQQDVHYKQPPETRAA